MQATWWWTGSITGTGDIPPGKQSYFNTAECTVTLRPECEEVNVTAYAPHAHFLGTAIWTEHYRPNKYGALTYVRCLCLPCTRIWMLSLKKGTLCCSNRMPLRMHPTSTSSADFCFLPS